MDIIGHFWVSLFYKKRNFQVIHNVAMEANMTQNNTRMLFGADMFLSTISFGDVNGHYRKLSCLFCNKVAILMQFDAHMEAHVA